MKIKIGQFNSALRPMTYDPYPTTYNLLPTTRYPLQRPLDLFKVFSTLSEQVDIERFGFENNLPPEDLFDDLWIVKIDNPRILNEALQKDS